METTDFVNDSVVELPAIETVSFQPIHKKYKYVILLNILGVTIAVFLAIFGITQIDFNEFDIREYQWILYTIAIVGIVYTVVLLLYGFPKRKYVIRDHDISYKSGVIFSAITTVPYVRIQHLEINQGPFSRLFKLATLNVYTAGDSSDDLEINGLLKTEALQIKEFISQKINE